MILPSGQCCRTKEKISTEKIAGEFTMWYLTGVMLSILSSDNLWGIVKRDEMKNSLIPVKNGRPDFQDVLQEVLHSQSPLSLNR